MKLRDPVRSVYQALSFLAVTAGLIGMAVSALFLGTDNLPASTAGASGFLAGSILVGSGLIATALLQLENSKP
jgi:hypothetical protein